MFRITEIYEDKEKAKLRLEGKIAEPCVPDLERPYLHYRDEKNKKVVLDFSGVTFINDETVSLFRKD